MTFRGKQRVQITPLAKWQPADFLRYFPILETQLRSRPDFTSVLHPQLLQLRIDMAEFYELFSVEFGRDTGAGFSALRIFLDERRLELHSSTTGELTARAEAISMTDRIRARLASTSSKAARSGDRDSTDSDSRPTFSGRCSDCRQVGHSADICAALGVKASTRSTCEICKQKGHRAADCSDAAATDARKEEVQRDHAQALSKFLRTHRLR